MKIFVCHSFIVTILLSVCTQVRADDKVMRFYGELNGIKDTLIVDVVNPIDAKANLVTKFVLKDNKFDVAIPLQEAAMLFIYEKGNMPVNHFNIVGVPGEELQLIGQLPKCGKKGSSLYQRYFVLENCVKNGLFTAYDYIRKHLDDDVSGILFGYLEKEQAYEIYPLLSDRLKQGRMRNYIDVVVNQYRRMDRIQEGKRICAVGTKAPDFTLNDLNGNPFSLSSLQGKYVVLDFWGSWCGSCIAGFPKMKDYYSKYSGKYEVLGIDCNDSEQRWKAAVEKYQLPWKHVFQSKSSPSIAEMYGVEGYPTQILIDPNGIIIARQMGDEEAFYRQLDILFAE